jgi:hypothetical protein
MIVGTTDMAMVVCCNVYAIELAKLGPLGLFVVGFAHKLVSLCSQAKGKGVGDCNLLHDAWDTVPTSVLECLLGATGHCPIDMACTIHSEDLTVIVRLNLPEISMHSAPTNGVAPVIATKPSACGIVSTQAPIAPAPAPVTSATSTVE